MPPPNRTASSNGFDSAAALSEGAQKNSAQEEFQAAPEKLKSAALTLAHPPEEIAAKSPKELALAKIAQNPLLDTMTSVALDAPEQNKLLVQEAKSEAETTLSKAAREKVISALSANPELSDADRLRDFIINELGLDPAIFTPEVIAALKGETQEQTGAALEKLSNSITLSTAPSASSSISELSQNEKLSEILQSPGDSIDALLDLRAKEVWRSLTGKFSAIDFLHSRLKRGDRHAASRRLASIAGEENASSGETEIPAWPFFLSLLGFVFYAVWPRRKTAKRKA